MNHKQFQRNKAGIPSIIVKRFHPTPLPTHLNYKRSYRSKWAYNIVEDADVHEFLESLP